MYLQRKSENVKLNLLQADSSSAFFAFIPRAINQMQTCLGYAFVAFVIAFFRVALFQFFIWRLMNEMRGVTMEENVSLVLYCCRLNCWLPQNYLKLRSRAVLKINGNNYDYCRHKYYYCCNLFDYCPLLETSLKR